MILFGISAFWRAADLAALPIGVFVLSLVGLTLVALSGFLGEELVYRHGVGGHDKPLAEHQT